MTDKRINKELEAERKLIKSAGRLHWVHWFVVIISLIITLSAWYISKEQLAEKEKIKFERESDHTIELVKERMELYENALWGGVSSIKSQGGDTDYKNWRLYANSLKIEAKYPGINGIGVIHNLKKDDIPAYLKAQHKGRPDFNIHPKHNTPDYWPITCVEPVSANAKAIGLDMAHETNRYTAAIKARDTGKAQITGPITLVQDSGKTPGFLFYVPFYDGYPDDNINDRKDKGKGLVYAPFVMNKLMAGTLEKENRNLSISIRDGEESLYDEFTTDNEDYDSTPLFTKNYELNMYGRPWSFQIQTTKSYESSINTSQPLMILIGGIFIDTLLLILFISLTRSNKRAIKFANAVSEELQYTMNDLETHSKALAISNEELEIFAYRTSHDLKAPMRTALGFSNRMEKDLEKKDYSKLSLYNEHTISCLNHLDHLVNSILNLSRVDNQENSPEPFLLQDNIEHIKQHLDEIIKENHVVIKLESGHKNKIICDKDRLNQVIENLISNGIKYSDKEDDNPFVCISSRDLDDKVEIKISDNGIGINKDEEDKLFTMFFRAHTSVSFGSGLGLYLVKKQVEKLGGNIYYKRNKNKGSSFILVI